MGGRASTPSESIKPPKNEYQQKQSSENIPSVFVDYQYYHLLNNYEDFNFERSHGEVYEIGGKRYTDIENACEAFEEFKLYAEKIGTENEVIDTPPKKLDIEVQDLQFGYIINSTVYLLYNEFNTIVKLSDNCMQCFVCGAVLFYEELDSHIETEVHQKNLDMYPPLEEFGLDIIRQRKDHYHCGVCSVVFHKELCDEHIEETTHLSNATSSVEIAYTIKNNNLEELRISENEDSGNRFNDNGNMNNDNINKKNDNVNRNNDNVNRNYDNENKNNDTKSNINDSEIVKNTKEQNILDSLVPINTGKRLFEIKYLVWNMIYVSKSAKKDTFYCMACKINDLRVNLAKHMNETSHKSNLDRFKINGFYEDLIRQDGEWSHCCTCNTIHYIDGTDIHLAEHKKETQACAKPLKSIPNYKNKINENRIENNDVPSTSAKVAKSNENIINEYRNENNDGQNAICILDDLVIVNTESKVFKIENLVWNMISVSKSAIKDTFYCMACKINDLRVHVDEHVNEMLHINNLDRFKINSIYGDHLIRQDETWSHCSTCNTIHYIDGTDMHIAKHKKKTQTYAESLKTIPKSENKTNEVQSHENKMNVNRIENNDVPSKSFQVSNSNEKIINDHRNENNDLPSTNPKVAKTNENIINDILKAIMNEKCYVFLFGFKIQVPLLSLNVIFRNDSGFYCLICKLNFLVQYIHDHLKSPLHIYVLNSIPAIQHFGYNYIRSIDNLPHCGICHLIIQPNVLLLHLQDPTHITLTNIALGIASPQPPIARVAPNVKNDSKNIINDTQNVNNDSQNTRNNNENIRNESNYINVINNRNITEELFNLQLRKDPIQTEDSSFNDGNIINDILSKNMSNLHLSKEVRTDDRMRNIQTVNNENIFNDKNANIHLSKEIRNDDEIRNIQTAFDANIVNKNNETTVKNVYAKINDKTLQEIEFNEISIHDILDLEVEIMFKCSYSQISWTTYNTLVPIGDGDRYCFLCERRVVLEELVDHIRSELHVRMITETKFVECYSTSLIRKKSALYHCGICNAILRKTDLKDHMEWTIHDEQRKICNTKLKKSERKAMKQEIIIPLQKEITHECENEPEIKIKIHISVTNDSGENNSENDLKKNKIIFLKGYDLKFTLDWETWHSISCKKQKFTCLICNEKLNELYIEDHVASEAHTANLRTPFLKNYFPSLLRQISDTIINCAICNTAMYDQDAVVAHLRGAKHKNKYESALSLRPENNSKNILTVYAWS